MEPVEEERGAEEGERRGEPGGPGEAERGGEDGAQEEDVPASRARGVKRVSAGGEVREQEEEREDAHQPGTTPRGSLSGRPRGSLAAPARMSSPETAPALVLSPTAPSPEARGFFLSRFGPDVAFADLAGLRRAGLGTLRKRRAQSVVVERPGGRAPPVRGLPGRARLPRAGRATGTTGGRGAGLPAGRAAPREVRVPGRHWPRGRSRRSRVRLAARRAPRRPALRPPESREHGPVPLPQAHPELRRERRRLGRPRGGRRERPRPRGRRRAPRERPRAAAHCPSVHPAGRPSPLPDLLPLRGEPAPLPGRLPARRA